MFPLPQNTYYPNNPRPVLYYHGIYLIILFVISLSIGALPFVYTDISIKSQGITRPRIERTEIRSTMSGIIDTLFVTEGLFVQKNQIILRIKDQTSGSRERQNSFEIEQRQVGIRDLTYLTTAIPDSLSIHQLHSALYTEQLNHFLQQKQELAIQLRKATKEVEINSSLAKSKVISPKEFFDIQNNYDRIQASIKVLSQGQISAWQKELLQNRLELSRYHNQANEVKTQADLYSIKAPISGIIQGISGRYSGGSVQSNETLCMISPEESLIGECYVQTKDAGFLRHGQVVRFQIDAFDYNYFGILTGRIISIDNDYTVIDNKPVFKVRCNFDNTQMFLKNGFKGQIKKGLSFQAGFTIARRSLWQLLFDKIDDWLNPNAPAKTS